jgi:predicted enzyme related to lactoylglutathione lyase
VKITASALSLNVADERASAEFVTRHFGFEEEMTADGFVALSRPDAGFRLIFLRTGLQSFKPLSMRGQRADGLLVAFVVEEIDAEYDRLQREGVAITTPIETEPWGERYFQVTDPNGVVLQLVQWVAAPPAEAMRGTQEECAAATAAAWRG